MYNHKEISKSWWLFHPLKGISITDESPNLENPIFQDATLISRKHIEQIVAGIAKLEEKHRHEIVSLLDPDPRFDWGEDFQSFIAIKRTGVMDSKDFRPQLIKDSYLRAQRIGALLGLILLAESRHGQTCCLVEQLHRRELRLGMIDIIEGGFRYQGGSGGWSNTICDPRRNYNLSRDDLENIIFKEPFKALTSILAPQKPSIPRSLRKAIEQSAVRLSEALHLVNSSARLLGAVTSIEILISNHGDSYESNLRRLAALLGEDAIIQYDACVIG